AGDVFVLPCPCEAFGLAIVEAMALGRPVVAANAGGPREIVIDGETGFLVAPSDPTSLACAITKLLDEPATARSMGVNGRLQFEQRFTAQTMAEGTIGVYHAALASARSRARGSSQADLPVPAARPEH